MMITLSCVVLVCGLTLPQNQQVIREEAQSDRAPETLVQVLECVALEKSRFTEAGFYSLDPKTPPDAEAQRRLVEVLTELSNGLPDVAGEALAEVHKRGGTVGSINDLLQMWLFAQAHRWITTIKPAYQPEELLAILEGAETAEFEFAPVTLPPGYREPEWGLRYWHPVLRSLPFVIWAALNDPSVWAENEFSREQFLAELLLLGERSEAHAAGVMRALDAPATFLYTIQYSGAGHAHPTTWYGADELRGKVGFTPDHLEQADQLQMLVESDPPVYGPGGSKRFLANYVDGLRQLIRRELMREGKLVADLARPDNVLALWKQKVATYPWPELHREFELYFDQMAEERLTHPSDEEFGALTDKRNKERLTEPEEKRLKELRSQRYLDTRKVFRGIGELIAAKVPPDQEIVFLERLEDTLIENGKSLLSEPLLTPAWEAAFHQDPQAAKDTLDSLDGVGAIAAKAAVTALQRSVTDVPGATETLLEVARSGSPEVRAQAMQNLRGSTPQQAYDVFTSALEEISDPRHEEGYGKSFLFQGALSLLMRRSITHPNEGHWTKEALARLFESGLWNDPAGALSSDTHAAWAAAHLTDAQVDALLAAGKLPKWVSAARSAAKSAGK